MDRSHVIHFHEYATPKDLPDADRLLLRAATEHLPVAYAPYSRFQVSAAVRLENGEIVLGANFENAAYPMCLCAERTALASCFSQYPLLKVSAMAITVKSPVVEVDRPASPCGACRQVMAETETRQGRGFRVLLRGSSGPIWAFARGSDLLPFGFGGELLLPPPVA